MGTLGTVNGLGQHRERRPRGDNQVLISLSRLFHFTISNPRITPATVMFMVWPPSPRVYVQVDLMYQHTGNHLSATPITMTHQLAQGSRWRVLRRREKTKCLRQIECTGRVQDTHKPARYPRFRVNVTWSAAMLCCIGSRASNVSVRKESDPRMSDTITDSLTPS